MGAQCTRDASATDKEPTTKNASGGRKKKTKAVGFAVSVTTAELAAQTQNHASRRFTDLHAAGARLLPSDGSRSGSLSVRGGKGGRGRGARASPTRVDVANMRAVDVPSVFMPSPTKQNTRQIGVARGPNTATRQPEL
jgi:hypothetical protein